MEVPFLFGTKDRAGLVLCSSGFLRIGRILKPCTEEGVLRLSIEHAVGNRSTNSTMDFVCPGLKPGALMINGTRVTSSLRFPFCQKENYFCHARKP